MARDQPHNNVVLGIVPVGGVEPLAATGKYAVLDGNDRTFAQVNAERLGEPTATPEDAAASRQPITAMPFPQPATDCGNGSRPHFVITFGSTRTNEFCCAAALTR
jgi:hypothetical protein